MPDKTPPQIERAAWAICEADNESWDEIPETYRDGGPFGASTREFYRRLATAALSTTLEPSEAEILAAALAMENKMFAEHELPLDAELHGKYLDTARAALIVAAKVRVGE